MQGRPEAPPPQRRRLTSDSSQRTLDTHLSSFIVSDDDELEEDHGTCFVTGFAHLKWLLFA